MDIDETGVRREAISRDGDSISPKRQPPRNHTPVVARLHALANLVRFADQLDDARNGETGWIGDQEVQFAGARLGELSRRQRNEEERRH
jgi:hypothetical protein